MNSDMSKSIRPSRVYVPVGLPGSGKSTWYNENMNSSIAHCSRDNWRFAYLGEFNGSYFSHEYDVFESWTDHMAELIKDGKDIYADATHLNHGSRRKLVNALNIKTNGAPYELIFIVFNLPIAECIRRNNLREGIACVPEDAIRNMAKRLVPPHKRDFPNIKAIWTIEE